MLRLGFGNVHVDERVLTVKRQASAESFNPGVVAAIARDGVVDLQMHTVRSWVRNLHVGHLEFRRIDLMLRSLWQTNKDQGQYNDQDEDDENETVCIQSVHPQLN